MEVPASGHESTAGTLRLAVECARQKTIKHLVVASASGATAERLLPYAAMFNIVCVSHVTGFTGNGEQEMSLADRGKLESGGIRVVTATHVLSGAERGLSKKFGGIYPLEIMANTLRIFGQGVKVALEIAVMALDAGTIPYGEKIVAIGGTGSGADTAVVLTPAHAQRILESRIHEIICKPYEF